MNNLKNLIRIFLISSSLIIFASCFSQKNENYEHTIKKELKDGKIDFETFIKQIKVTYITISLFQFID